MYMSMYHMSWITNAYKSLRKIVYFVLELSFSKQFSFEASCIYSALSLKNQTIFVLLHSSFKFLPEFRAHFMDLKLEDSPATHASYLQVSNQ